MEELSNRGSEEQKGYRYTEKNSKTTEMCP